jgi:Zn-dependent M28 family amino/carboxypeptidase
LIFIVMDQADEIRLRRHLENLCFPRSQVLNPGAVRRTARYIEQEFRSYGLSVSIDEFSHWLTAWHRNKNMIASCPRSDPKAPCLLIGAHYDAVPFSPGADDNGSGVAVMLEAARILGQAGPPLRLQVRFVAFAMEECGFIGSLHYVETLKKSDTPVVGMLSLECVGYTSSRPGSQIIPPGLSIRVPDRGDFIAIVGNTDSGGLKDCLESAIHQDAPELKAVSLLVPENGRDQPATRLSDHSPFWDAGHPALLITDTAFLRNPHYHRPSDRIETLDFSFMRRLTQAIVALPKELARSIRGSV